MSILASKNCCYFFHPPFVFFLTLVQHESIHSSTAIPCCSIDATHRKGRIGKWQLKRQPRKHLQRRPRRKPQKRSKWLFQPTGNTLGGRFKASPLVFLAALFFNLIICAGPTTPQ